MRTLLGIPVLLVLCTACYAQEKNDPAKIELTYSLSGPEMYQTWCASCHGAGGKGDGPAASALKKAPADLTQLSKKNRGKFPTERVRDFIEGKNEGAIAAHGSREMPIWGRVFQRISDSPASITYRVVTLSTYVESLQQK